MAHKLFYMNGKTVNFHGLQSNWSKMSPREARQMYKNTLEQKQRVHDFDACSRFK